jgi:murein L,D-transpeptidase YafK
MKPMYIVYTLIFGLVCFGLFFYFKPFKPLDKSGQIDKIVVIKLKHRLDLFSNNQLVKSYRISIGRGSKGPKVFEGDNKTPEGLYFINDKNANSGYHKNLGISYPNEMDVKRSKSIGRNPGGLIKIHGMKNGFGWIGRFHLFSDWTSGCIAMTDKEIDELYEHINIGTPIEIKP